MIPLHSIGIFPNSLILIEIRVFQFIPINIDKYNYHGQKA
jgi:hypothetical protein